MIKSESINPQPRLVAVVLFMIPGLIISAATFVTFLSKDSRSAIKLGMVILSLAGWLIFRRNDHLQSYAQIAVSYFAISTGVVLAQFYGNLPLQLSGYSVNSVQGVAMAKFGEALLIVLPILVIHFATGGDKDGIFLGAGNRKLTMTAGITGVAVFSAIGYLQTRNTGLQWIDFANALPWILIFTFSNAFLEELWFRALFLRKLEPLVGARTAIVLTSIVFAAGHISSTYVIDIIIFMVILLVLALLWGWLMRKSNSIWGPVLIHAGADLLVMLGFLAGIKI